MTFPAVATPLRWLGGQIDVKLEIATSIVPEGGGAWDVGEWDEAVWSESELAFHDITQYLIRATIRRGQERWDSRYTAGTATFVMDNRTGLFTLNAGEDPWSAPFRPGRMIRLVVIPDPDTPEVRVARFTGRIDSTTDEFTEGNADIITIITAVDALGDLHDHNPPAMTTATGVQDTDDRVVTVLDRIGYPEELRSIQPGFHTMQTSFLAQTTLEECQRAADAEGGAFYADGDNVLVFRNRDWLLPASPSMEFYEALVLTFEPVAYWRMGDHTDRTVDSSGNGHTLTWSGSPSSGVEGVTADDIAQPVDGTNDFATVANEVDLETLDDITIEMWVRPHDTTGSFQTIASCRGASGTLWEITYNPDDDGDFQFWQPITGGGEYIGIFTEGANKWSHLAVTVTDNGDGTRTVRRYLNGQSRGTRTGSGTDPGGPYAVNIGRRAQNNDQYFDGDISEFVFYDRVLSVAEIHALYNAKDTPDNTRSTTIQGYIGYGGDLPVAYDGEPTAEIADTIRTPWELQRVRNDIQFARDGGELQTVEDTDSQTAYGVRTYSRRDFNNNSDSEVLALAERNLAAYKDARPRLEPITIVANADPDNEDLNRLFWDSRFGDLVSVKVQTLHGWSYEREAHIIGITDVITGEEWSVTFTLDDSIIAVLEELEES